MSLIVKDESSSKRRSSSDLDRWIDETVDQQSAYYEEELFEVIDKLLQEVVSAPEGYRSEKYEVSGHHHHQQQQLGQQRFEQQQLQEKPKKTSSTGRTPVPTQPYTPTPTQQAQTGIIGFIESLVRPFILQLRADIRNVLIWICFGAAGSPIDGKIDGSDAFSHNAVIQDQLAIQHPNGILTIQDIMDPNVAKMALDCLTTHFQTFSKEIQSLFWTRLNDAKEFLLDQVRNLIPLPRFLIPFAKEIGEGERMAEVQEDGQTGVQGTNGEVSVDHQIKLEQEQGLRQTPEDAFAIWLVANVMHKLKVETDDNDWAKKKVFQKGKESRKMRSRNKEEVHPAAATAETETAFPGCEWLKDRLR